MEATHTEHVNATNVRCDECDHTTEHDKNKMHSIPIHFQNTLSM